MKIFLKIFMVVVLLAIVLQPNSRALANTNSTEIEGKLWLVDVYLDPDYRSWDTGHFVSHWRADGMLYYFDMSDPRLNGWAPHSINGEAHYDAAGTRLFWHIWTQYTVYAEPELITPIWECKVNGFFDANFIYTAENLCKGVGINKNLLVKFDAETDWSTPYIPIVGELKEVGNQ